MSIILGINQVAGLLTGQHDAAAAIIKDGKLIATVEEERLNRQRHSKGFPRQAVQYCLKEAGVTESDIDVIAIGYNPYAILERFFFFLSAWSMFNYALAFWIYRYGVRDLLKKSGAKLMYVDHHLAHAASAYRCADFGDANVLTIDGSGETECAALFEGKNGKLKRVADIPIAKWYDVRPWRSIGKAYTRMTDFLLLGAHGEGKLMGLASYGNPRFDMSKILEVKSFSDWTIDRRNISEQYKQYQRHDPKSEITQDHKDLAASLQDALEKAFVNLGRDAYQKTGLRKFGLSGGCALNCNANSRLLSQEFCDGIFVQPASHDGGIALGAALEAMHRVGDGDFVEFKHAYWGPGYTNEEIEKVLKEAKVPYRRVEDIAKETAKYVASGVIVGWFQGRSELGPRSLGNRSIITNCQIKGMNDKVNVEVKHREVWRPFAPSVTREDAPKYFEGMEKSPDSPFMLQTFYVRPEYRDVLPAITHVDGSSRIQTVTQQENSRFYALLKEMEKLTGHPVVMNTSFNDAGEPIVQSPKDAIRCFFATGFDVLAIGDFLVEKPHVLRL